MCSQFRKRNTLSGLNKSADPSRSLPQPLFGTRTRFSRRNRVCFERIHLISVIRSENSSRSFSRFDKKIVPEKFPSLVFRVAKMSKWREIQTCNDFISFGQESLPRFENCVLTRFTVIPGPRTLFPLAPSSLGGTNISGSGPICSTGRYIIKYLCL